MKIIQIIKKFKLKVTTDNLKNLLVKDISVDSRVELANSIFIAVKGAKIDGHEFIVDAVKNKAKIIIYQKLCLDELLLKELKKTYPQVIFLEALNTRELCPQLAAYFYGNPAEKIKVVGITGTNGKTTITYLIEAILQKAKIKTAVIGTVNYRIGKKVIPSINTTPGPLELQRMLAQMVKEKVKYLVMEVSSHGLDQLRTEGIDFSAGIFTNLTQDHLDYHHTMENYFQAKTKLFRPLNKNAAAIINNDDFYGKRINRLTKAKIFTYGVNSKAKIQAKSILMDSSGTQFTLKYDNKVVCFKINLVGIHNVYNCLAAISWAISAKINIKLIKDALENFTQVPGRLERIKQNDLGSVFVDYAHTPDALKNVINTLRAISKDKILVVFGCGGDRDKSKRPVMGDIASSLADFVIITNDNPRSESPEMIVQDIKKGIKNHNFCVIYDRMKAIKKALSLARKSDIVLVAGKGHENYQIVKNKVFHFDDREAVCKCLNLKN